MVIKWTDMTKRIADREGKAVEMNIAQINEVLSITLGILNEHTDEEILSFVRKYGA